MGSRVLVPAVGDIVGWSDRLKSWNSQDCSTILLQFALKGLASRRHSLSDNATTGDSSPLFLEDVPNAVEREVEGGRVYSM